MQGIKVSELVKCRFFLHFDHISTYFRILSYNDYTYNLAFAFSFPNAVTPETCRIELASCGVSLDFVLLPQYFFPSMHIIVLFQHYLNITEISGYFSVYKTDILKNSPKPICISIFTFSFISIIIYRKTR